MKQRKESKLERAELRKTSKYRNKIAEHSILIMAHLDRKQISCIMKAAQGLFGNDKKEFTDRCMKSAFSKF